MVNKSYLNKVRRLFGNEIPDFMRKAVADIKYQKRVSDLRKRGAVPFTEKGFEKISWDIFRRTIEPDAGSIWKKETIKNANGEDEAWIVVYTDGDNDRIVRQVKASKKTAELPGEEFEDPEVFGVFIDRKELPNGYVVISSLQGFEEKPSSWVVVYEAEDLENSIDDREVEEKNIYVESVNDLYSTLNLDKLKKVFNEVVKEYERKSSPPGHQYGLKISKTSSKTSHSPGTIVQIDVPHGNLYEKYNGKIGEVVAAVPDRSKVSFKDLPSTWFEDNIIRPVSLCPICNAKMSLQMLKKLGTFKCKCGASYSKRQLEKIANENRINKVAAEKRTKIAFLESERDEYFYSSGSLEDLNHLLERLQSRLRSMETDISEYNANPSFYQDKMEEVKDLINLVERRIQKLQMTETASIKKAQNVVQTLWVDDPKDLRHYFKSLQSPPTSPAKEPSKEEPEELEEVDLEPEEETEKEASIKRGQFVHKEKVLDNGYKVVLTQVSITHGGMCYFAVYVQEPGEEETSDIWQSFEFQASDIVKKQELQSEGENQCNQAIEQTKQLPLSSEIQRFIDTVKSLVQSGLSPKDAYAKAFKGIRGYWLYDSPEYKALVLNFLQHEGIQIEKEASKQSYKVETETCPKCGSEMTLGASHIAEGELQWECHGCGYIEQVRRASKKKTASKPAREWLKLIHENWDDFDDLLEVLDGLQSDYKEESDKIEKSPEREKTYRSGKLLDLINYVEKHLGKLSSIASIKKEAVEIPIEKVVGHIKEDFLETYRIDETTPSKDIDRSLRDWLDSENYIVTEEEFHQIFNSLFPEELRKETSIKKKADGMEALRGGGGAGSDKLTPMNWSVKETKFPRLPEKPEEQEESETEEEVEEIHVIVNPKTKDVHVSFEGEEGEKIEKEEEPIGAEAPTTEGTEGELETEEVEEEEVGEGSAEKKSEPATPVVF